MIFVTGDTHGDALYRLGVNAFPEQENMDSNEENFVIICGDFGGVWDRSIAENYQLDWLNNKPFKTLFVDGNHENYDLFKTYPYAEWHGGEVQFIRPNIIHLLRGEIYEIEGKTFLTFGGARSHDISDGILNPDDPNICDQIDDLRNRYKRFWRINHIDWWEEEMPSDDEMEHGVENLNKVGNAVDYIITHCCSSSAQALMAHGRYKPNKLTSYFEEIRSKVEFKKWFFGHYHDNRAINDKEILLYDKIIRIS